MKLAQIEAVLANVNGTVFAGLDYVSVVKLKGGKKNPMQNRVTKRTTGANVILFSNTKTSGYEALVRRRIENEGGNQEDFVVKPRAWGVRVGDTPIIEHKEAFYLEVFFQTPGVTEYFLDGEPIEKEDIEGLDDGAPKSDEAKENAAKAQGGIETKVVIRTLSVESIEEIRLKGEVLN